MPWRRYGRRRCCVRRRSARQSGAAGRLLAQGGSLGGAELVLGAGLAVLEPVEDVGVGDVAVLLQPEPDAADLVARRVDHAGVEDRLQDPNLLWPRVPSWLRFPRGPAALLVNPYTKHKLI